MTCSAAIPGAVPSGTRMSSRYESVVPRPSITKVVEVVEFVLLPEAGNLLHPAHRVGDQMISVHVADGERAQYSPMALTWVWGILRVLPGESDGTTPLYRIAVTWDNKRRTSEYFVHNSHRERVFFAADNRPVIKLNIA